MMNESGKIDINVADQETLAALPGIGAALAARIVQYRENVHLFEEVIELAAVPGISERMVRQFAEQVKVTVTTPVSSEPGVSPSGEPAETTDGTTVAAIAESGAPAGVLAETAEADSSAEIILDLPDGPVAALDDESVAEQSAELAEEPGVEIDAETDDEPLVEPLAEPEDKPLIAAASPEETAASYLTDADLVEPSPEPTRMPQEAFMADESGPPVAALADNDVPAAGPAPSATPERLSLSQRRGCVFVVLGTLFGALFGVLITLAILAAINGGTLSYAQSNAQTRFELRTAERTQDTLVEQVSGLAAGQDSLVEDVAAIAPQLETAATARAELAQDLDETNQNLAGTAAEIKAVMAAVSDMEERMGTLLAAAANFDLFLTGMRDLLLDIQGVPPGLAPITSTLPMTATLPVSTTIVPTLTPDSATPTTATPAVSATPDPLATRTPRPTATSIPRPTSRPTAQPEP